MLHELDPAAVRRWAAACVEVLAAHREEIDRINVFPVPDADTGTNLLATMRAAVDELDCSGGLGLEALAAGALRGARGNSGLVLAQLLRGLAQAVDRPRERDSRLVSGGQSVAARRERDTGLVGERLDQAGVAFTLSASGLVEGLRLGAALAAQAFETPVVGTAVTVLAAAAASCDGDKLAAVVDAAVSGATAALAETPRQLPVLARAGVVDAGGRGVQLLLEALSSVVNERPLAVQPAPRPVRDASVLVATREAGSAEHEYEVMYLLDSSTAERVAALRAELASIGDSVAVVGDGDIWNVHVHCTDAGAAIEVGVNAGRPHRITVVRFADHQAAPETPPTGRAVVAVTGVGVASLFRGEGVVVVSDGVDVDEVRAAITGTGAAHVVVLPNSAAGTTLAEAAAVTSRDAGHDVVVVPTESPVQGLAALAVHDPGRRASDDVVAMAEAAAATRCGSVELADREALTWAGRCQPGDVLGLVDGEVVLIGADVTTAACALVERMLSAGGELVTALLGSTAPAGLRTALTAWLHHDHPEVELTVHHCDHDEPLLVGVE